MLFYENLDEIIFHRHEMFDVDELVILSGYVGPQPVSRLKSLPFKTSVIYGMYGSDSIGAELHKSLNRLSTEIENTSIMYSNMPIHSKCYIWRKNRKIVAALVGSANFSVSGLSNPYKEVLAETTFDTFEPLNQYLNVILQNCIDCHSETVKLKQQFSAELPQTCNTTPGICRISFLDRFGDVPTKSGLNWGLSNAHTSIGDAYIKISKDNLENFPSLFPPKQLEAARVIPGGKAGRQNDAVEFIWDDGTVMEGLLEGTQWLGDTPYPKQVCSSPKKNIIGLYLRGRMGLNPDHLITREDLDNYGRTHIDMSLQDEGIYYLDFKV